MRISDWSSDVCSSDLVTLDVPDEGFNAQPVLIKRVEIDPATTKVRFEAETETSSKHAFALGQTTTPPPPVTLTAPDLKPTAPLVGLWDVEGAVTGDGYAAIRSDAHTSELQSLMRTSYDVFCLKKKKNK